MNLLVTSDVLKAVTKATLRTIARPIAVLQAAGCRYGSLR